MILIKKIIPLSLLIILVFSLVDTSFCRISEGQFNAYRSRFLSKVIKDNPSSKARIKQCLYAMLKGGRAGLRLIDKLGLFLYKARSNKVSLLKTRFFYNKGIFFLFIVMEDDHDGQQYTMFMEYGYNGKGRSCHLRDIYFSLIVKERLKELREFFKQR